MIVLKVTEDLDWIETIISVIEIFFTATNSEKPKLDKA